MNFVAGFDGVSDGVRGDAQEIDVTIDYRVKKGFLNSFWLRVRGSWLNEESADHNGTEIRGDPSLRLPSYLSGRSAALLYLPRRQLLR